MKKVLLSTIIGISMLITFSPVFAKDFTTIKPLEHVKLENKSDILTSTNLNTDFLKSKLKLNEFKLKMSKKDIQETFKSVQAKSTPLAATTTITTTTGPGIIINDTPEQALPIAIGTVYEGVMQKEGDQRWYAFENTSSGKLTAYMQALANVNIDYDLYLFKYNEQTNGLDPVVSSTYNPGINEQLSTIGSSNAIYFIAVNSAMGFDNINSFKLIVNYSAKYGANEPDDSIFQAKPYTDSLSMIDTIDNYFDEDWARLQINTNATYLFSLENPSTIGTYATQIVDGNLNVLATLQQGANNATRFSITKGVYYIRTISISGFDTDNSYKLNIAKVILPPSSVTITPSSSRITVNGEVALRGYVTDAAGNPVSGKNVFMMEGTRYIDNRYTDANGYYNFPDCPGQFLGAGSHNITAYVWNGTLDENVSGAFIFYIDYKLWGFDIKSAQPASFYVAPY
ncbi:carboxypeptidase-like regulatory domain-containing protein [Clostridium sp. CF012]|uniref:carboxypeptidase-like regulatory domain-containing protein n=1 Tax=Clostridium sp. CF012 TaxID=2843319 RepID=UPI001C0C9AA5|nr:carboxypeptidase-like regulatory domain-containing protein [Clostridium sp. CF012]MBU3142229.1 carboxypeptidase-like regulatory domain-containing protein [Clostridium sp. CF012]